MCQEVRFGQSRPFFIRGPNFKLFRRFLFLLIAFSENWTFTVNHMVPVKCGTMTKNDPIFLITRYFVKLGDNFLFKIVYRLSVIHDFLTYTNIVILAPRRSLTPRNVES